MIENTTLKSVEEIILQNKKRNSRFISIMNSLFENIYNNFILCYCSGNEDEFKNHVKHIIEKWSFPDSDFEKENLFIIKQLVILALKQNTSEDVFVNQKLVLSNFVNVNIKYNEWDNLERWPYLSYTLNKQYFANTYNDYVNAPIFIDAEDNIRLKEDYQDANFDKNHNYFKTLDNANFGTYLKNFFTEFVSLENKVKEIVENLNK